MNESNVIKMRNPFEGDSRDLKIFTGSKANTSFRKHLVREKYETHLSKKNKNELKQLQQQTIINETRKSRRSYSWEIEKVLL